MNTFAQIKSAASRVAADAGVGGVVPTPLETIANSLGFQSLAFNGPPDLAGAIEHATRRIFVNSNDPATRQRFTLAHELGHAVLHQGESVMDYRRNMESSQTDRKEIEANFFAANLLMPESIFRNAWQTRERNYERLARLFGVSPQAAQIRAKTLGLA